MTSATDHMTPEPAPKFRRRRQGADAAAALGLSDLPGHTVSKDDLPADVPPTPPRVEDRGGTSRTDEGGVGEAAQSSGRTAPVLPTSAAAAHRGAGARVVQPLPPTESAPGPNRTQGSPLLTAVPQREAAIRPAARDDVATDDQPLDIVLDLPTQQTPIYIDSAILGKVKKLTQVEQITYATVVMDAIDAALESGLLEGLVRARQVVERHEGSRFPARRASRRRARGSGSSRVLWPVQMTEEERAVLGDLEAETAAPSRSALVSAAVEWYVETPKIRRRITGGPGR